MLWFDGFKSITEKFGRSAVVVVDVSVVDVVSTVDEFDDSCDEESSVPSFRPP